MNDIQKIIKKNTVTMLKRMSRRYGNIVTSSLIGAVLFIIFFYTISDGFRESPLGAAMGVIVILSVTGFAWRRYQQIAAHDHTADLNIRLKELIAQFKQNLVEEQILVVTLPLAFLISSRLLNGRGFTNMGQPEVIIGLVIMVGFVLGLIRFIRHNYQRDINELQDLLAQLTEK